MECRQRSALGMPVLWEKPIKRVESELSAAILRHRRQSGPFPLIGISVLSDRILSLAELRRRGYRHRGHAIRFLSILGRRIPFRGGRLFFSAGLVVIR